MSHDDFEREPIPGLPALPPAGETVLWQGSPQWRLVARRIVHVDLVAFYIAAIAVWRGIDGIMAGKSPSEVTASVAIFVGLSGIAVAILLWLARGIARSTVYTVTSHRVAIRFGMALPVTINLPFKLIDRACVRDFGDGHGDLALELAPGERVAYLVLWPHVRPWHLRAPQPMLRCLPELSRVTALLATALQADQARRLEVGTCAGVSAPSCTDVDRSRPSAFPTRAGDPLDARPALTAAE
jgi:hypothetical protein